MRILLCLAFLLFYPLFADEEKPSPIREVPDIDSVDESATGREIVYGREMISRTAFYLGPKGSVRKLMGNRMSCENCHTHGASAAYSLRLVTAHARYPRYDEGKKKTITLADRINDCVKTALRGSPIPENSREMKAILLYLQWLGQKTRVGENELGDGLLPFSLDVKTADAKRGRVVYDKQCVSCHMKDGSGREEKGGKELAIPPAWGAASYRRESKLSELAVLAPFLRATMPFGTSWDFPILTEQEALDVASFLNQQSR